jgi:hypothetical protein
MALAERKISGVASRETSSVEARLAGLEAESARLREEVASLQDEIRWLTGEDDEDRDLLSHGWLGRGWVRASMLMAVGGFVAFVSVPYLWQLFETSPSQAAASSSLATIRPAEPAVRPAIIAPKAAASEYIPAPARVRSREVPAPAYVRKRAATGTRESR